MSVKAEGTAQPHVLAVRPQIRAMLPDPKNTFSKLPNFPNREFTAEDVKKLQKALVKPAQGGAWWFEIESGQLITRLASPIRWADVERAFYQGLIASGMTAKTSAFVAKYEGKAALVQEGDSVGDSGEHERQDIIAGKVTLLTKTSKMGCYSWNLPAGPPHMGGTCPGSQIAFYVDDPNDTRRLERLKSALRRSKESAIAAHISAVPGGADEAVRRFICNGCYAMKGAYGNPSVITVMEWRRKWLEEYALPSGDFPRIMELCIRLAQHHSKNALARRGGAMTPEQLAAVPHPGYFRIHDSGDMWSREYFHAWLAVCRKMKDIHFWAPTRTWAHETNRKYIDEAIQGGMIPPNLALRPSGLFFDGPEPFILGMASGTSASNISFKVERGNIKLDIEASDPNAWGCPAYLPQQLGGGALPVKPAKVKANPTPKQQSYAMYPPVDDSTPEAKGFTFYQALFDPKTQRYIIDPGTGRPMSASKKSLAAHPGAEVRAAQTFQAAGCCSVARDPHHAQECRVCWGTTSHKRAENMKSLPVVYGKH